MPDIAMSVTLSRTLLGLGALERPHAPGRPVSNSTYEHHKCRCVGCKAANKAYRDSRRDVLAAHATRYQAARAAGNLCQDCAVQLGTQGAKRCPPCHARQARPKIPMIDRVLARLDMSDPSACWLWPGADNGHDYGAVTGDEVGRSRTTHAVHVVTYEHLIGPVPPGRELDHLCRNRLCCNPAHLEPVTHRVNFLRGMHPWAVLHREQTGLTYA